MADSTSKSTRPTAAPSPWGSEESRDFLQERLCRFARIVFLVSLPFFFAGWLIDLGWYPSALERGMPLTRTHFLNLGWLGVLLVMWLTTRRGALPGPVLTLIDTAGVFLVCEIELGMCFSLPVLFRPDLLAVVALIGILLYRAAIVPSDPVRTAWLGVACAAPLPVLTYLAYTRSARPPEVPPAWAYTLYAFLFAVLVVLLTSKTSAVIYGLRETIREARRLGPYTLESKIGEGGMGAVYRARHALLRRPTAVKILPPERAGEMDLARFEREVQMTSQLTSPHTVAIYDFGRTPDGLFYYAMEYLDGIDLQELVSRDGPMPAGRVVRVLRQVCEALGEAHRVGLIHRDIKPANILLCERGGRADVAKVVDFGLVKNLAAATGPGATREDIVLGTPHYLSPEALRTPDRIDARSDIYALGATAYFLLTGTAVFDGPLPQIFADHLGKMPEPPSRRTAHAIPPDLEAAVLGALAKDPNDRPESVEEFDRLLARCAVAPWTDADAAVWWRTRGARLRAIRAGAAPAESSAAEKTVAAAERA
jgi:eukaryotic-like serine/threonine-protein kinase